MTNSRVKGFIAAAIAVPVAALTLAACGSSNNTATASNSPPTTPSGAPATVGVASAGGLGKILVDSQGRTLYLFQKDSGTHSACTGACAASWPPLRASHKPTVGSGANASMVTTAPRSDGAPQVVYNGHPLYLFSGDKNPGDTNGQGVTAFGAAWYAVSPAGATVLASSSGSGSGTGGY
jgi:predicted lipoprotein with Yx(FWY)xxD motif